MACPVTGRFGHIEVAGPRGLERNATPPRCQRMQRKKTFMDEFLADRWCQLDDGKPRPSEDDIQRAQLGPRGEPGKPDRPG